LGSDLLASYIKRDKWWRKKGLKCIGETENLENTGGSGPNNILHQNGSTPLVKDGTTINKSH